MYRTENGPNPSQWRHASVTPMRHTSLGTNAQMMVMMQSFRSSAEKKWRKNGLVGCCATLYMRVARNWGPSTYNVTSFTPISNLPINDFFTVMLHHIFLDFWHFYLPTSSKGLVPTKILDILAALQRLVALDLKTFHRAFLRAISLWFWYQIQYCH